MSGSQIDVLLVAVDGSKGSQQAVSLAGGFAQRMGVGVQLLYVFPNSAAELFGPPGEGMPHEQFKYLNPDNFQALREESARKVFDEARALLEPGLQESVQEVLLSGQPREAIIAYAKERENPMILVGRRGLSSIGEMFLGSVSQYLVHHANCPVTVVN